MDNLQFSTGSKETYSTSIVHNIDIITKYKNEYVILGVRFCDTDYQSGKIDRELMFISTPYCNIDSKCGYDPESSFKENMFYYYCHKLNKKHTFNMDDHPKEEVEEVKDAINQMWNQIKIVMDENNIPIPKWYGE